MSLNDRVLPHNLEAEQSVLGAILMHGEGLDVALAVIDECDFFRDAHRRIFGKMTKVTARREPIDLVTLKNELGRSGELDDVGGPAYIAALVDGVPRSTNVEHYARIIKEHSTRRNLIYAANKIVAAAYDQIEEPTAIAAAAQADLSLVIDTASQAAAGAVLVTLADVQAETVSYVWPGRIARGKLQLVVGDPGLGKSQLTLDCAARVSRGAAWPDGGRAPLGDVILLSAEDGLADTIRPRLDALGADVTRVHALTAIRTTQGNERGFCLASDVAQLEHVIEQTGAILVVIDPISAYLGPTDSYKDGEVRGVLAPLAALGERSGAAIEAVMHLGKGAQRPALYRALGSVAFVAAARIVLAVAEHPDDETRRVLAPVKANICAPSAVLSFTVGAGRLQWDADPVANLDIDALLSTGPDRQERRAADDWLRELLSDGQVAVREIRKAATGGGLSWHTVERAKARLKVGARKTGYARDGCWFWHLPNTASDDLITASHDQVAALSDTSSRTADSTGPLSQ
jgi:RecA-family ATPase